MADVVKKYVDYAGLSKYDELIKGQILSDAANAADAAVGALDVSEIDLATVSGSIVSIAGIKEVDGKIEKGSNVITLQPIARTGAAADVSYDNTISGLSATNVKTAIDEVAAASAGGVESKTVYLQDASSGQTAYAKVYNLYQGANSSDMSQNILVGTINIAKDKVVQDGHIVTVSDGVDSDGDTVPTGTADGTYVKLTLQNVDTPIYINVQDLVDVYTGGTTAEATVAISNTNEVTVTINKIAATKIIYQAEQGQSGDPDYKPEINVKSKIDAVEAKVDAIDVAGDIADAIGALDTSSDVAIASNNSSTGAVTFAGSIAESDGIIGAGVADNVVFTPVTNAEIEALFPTPTP